MQAGTKYRVRCLSQQGMEVKIVLPSFSHYSDGHFVETNLKAIFKGFYFYGEGICCLFPETKNIFVDSFFLFTLSTGFI